MTAPCSSQRPKANGLQIHRLKAGAAYGYLSQIDPSASCYAQAKALGKKISASVKEDYDFETKEKYRNAVELEKQRIDAARQAAVAWAQNQPKTVVKNNWIVW